MKVTSPIIASIAAVKRSGAGPAGYGTVTEKTPALIGGRRRPGVPAPVGDVTTKPIDDVLCRG